MRQRTPFRRIGLDEARPLLRRDDVAVFDVRDAASFARGSIEGARRISMANLSAVIGAMPKAAPVLIYCYRGNASQDYAQIFSDFGFSEVYSLDGGYEVWSKQPSLASRGTVDDTVRQWLATHGFPPDDINATIGNGTTPIMKASHAGESDILRRLLAAGARLDARNADGNNALWLACVGGHLDIMDMLISAGIDIDNRNDNDATPLMYAASAGKPAVVERLLLAHADISPETPDGFTALDMAASIECLTLLRQATRKLSDGDAKRVAGAVR